MGRKEKADFALKFLCPTCAAEPDEVCKDWRGKTVLYPHNRRVTLATDSQNWDRRPEIDNYEGSIDALISALQGAKAAGFAHILFDSGVAPIYARVR